MTFKGAIFGRHHVDEEWTPVHVQDPDITHNRRLHCGVDKEYGVSSNLKLMDFFCLADFTVCTDQQFVIPFHMNTLS